MKIFHNSHDTEYREPFGAAKTGSEVSLSIDVKGEIPARVRVMVWKGETLSPKYYEMSEDDFGSGRYKTLITMPDEGCLLWYAFEIQTERESDEEGSREISTIYYGNNHDMLGGVGTVYDYSPGCYQITVYKQDEVPDWYMDGIVYQIFPDRFARDAGWRERVESANARVNRRRDDIRRIVEEDWRRPAYYVRDYTGKVVEWPIYGGSLKGIEEKLHYLKSLGTTAIYLNPVFEATSNHRYDTGDYMHIDPALGTDEDFRSLAHSAKEMGIKLILDGVFSHTGADSIYFDRFGNYELMHNDGESEDGISHGSIGAWSNPDSPFHSWFKFDSNEKCGYKSWWGVEDLPEVEENDPSYREFMLGEDGVIAHWLEMGASGIRLDVADELPDSFIEGVRERMKKSDPDALLIGEVWEDASNKVSYGESRRYLFGDELQGTMNYPLRTILLDYINYTITSGNAARRLISLSENYPKENFYAALNIIGSHDRERIFTAMAGAQDRDSAARKVRLLAALQYALPGVPCIYYGDEAGLMGGADPENRSGYPWGSEAPDIAYHYRMLGLIYDEHPVLKSGAFKMLSGRPGINDDVFAFVRGQAPLDTGSDDELILVLANRSYGDTEVDLSAFDELRCGFAFDLLRSKDMPLDENGTLGKIRMKRLSAMMICLRRERPRDEVIGRDCGVICHISSLPKPVLGKPAKDFVDFIASAGFGIWQMLPLNPAGVGNSPYSSNAAFAGEPLFINRDELPGEEWLEEFKEINKYWLYDYVAYRILKERNEQKAWFEWPDEHKFADSEDVLSDLTEEETELADEIIKDQYYFCIQWNDLREYANSKGVRLMGDLPMFMAPDSADVWANKDIFIMDDLGGQQAHAGVPPDAFSTEGQDWGNPLYDWDRLKETGYAWWIRRMRQCAERFDILRIDHFRGLSEFFAIPEGAGPKEGHWQHSGGLKFMEAVRRMLDEENHGMKLLAEDLGFLDDGVLTLLRMSGLSGMDIWQFSAGEMMAMRPEMAAKRAFYTGTHDNNTLAGYLSDLIKSENGWYCAEENAHQLQAEIYRRGQDIIRRIYESPAELAMLQLQDVFMLGSDARINVPGVPEGNWTWKVDGNSIYEAFPEAAERAEQFRELAQRTGR